MVRFVKRFPELGVTESNVIRFYDSSIPMPAPYFAKRKVREALLKKYPMAGGGSAKSDPLLRQKEFPTNYPQDAVDILKAMAFNDGKGLNIVGSMSVRSQEWAGDYDGYQVATLKESSDAAAAKAFARQWADNIKKLRALKDVWIGDIKCGTVEDWRVIPRTARVVDGKIVDYNAVACRQRIDRLKSKGVISPAEAADAAELCKPSPSVTDFLLAKQKVKFHVVRWRPDEILAGRKKLRDGTVMTLAQAIQTPTIGKMDCVGLVQNSRFTDFSVIYEFRNGSKTLNPDKINIAESLREAILAYSAEGNYFKVLKRRYALAKAENDLAMVRKLTPILNSDLGRLYHITGDIGTLVNLLEAKRVPMEKVRFEIDQFIGRLSGIWTMKDYLKDESEIIGKIHAILKMSKPKMALALDKLGDQLEGYLQHATKAVVQRAGLPLKGGNRFVGMTREQLNSEGRRLADAIGKLREQRSAAVRAAATARSEEKARELASLVAFYDSEHRRLLNEERDLEEAMSSLRISKTPYSRAVVSRPDDGRGLAGGPDDPRRPRGGATITDRKWLAVRNIRDGLVRRANAIREEIAAIRAELPSLEGPDRVMRASRADFLETEKLPEITTDIAEMTRALARHEPLSGAASRPSTAAHVARIKKGPPETAASLRKKAARDRELLRILAEAKAGVGTADRVKAAADRALEADLRRMREKYAAPAAPKKAAPKGRGRTGGAKPDELRRMAAVRRLATVEGEIEVAMRYIARLSSRMMATPEGPAKNALRHEIQEAHDRRLAPLEREMDELQDFLRRVPPGLKGNGFFDSIAAFLSGLFGKKKEAPAGDRRETTADPVEEAKKALAAMGIGSRKEFNKWALKNHPDKGGDTSKFQRVSSLADKAFKGGRRRKAISPASHTKMAAPK